MKSKKCSPAWMKEMRDRKKEYARQKRINSSVRTISCPACFKKYEKSKDVVNYSFICARCGNEILVNENGKVSVFSNIKTQMDPAKTPKNDSQKDKKEIADRQDSGNEEKKESKKSQMNIKKIFLAVVGIICVGVLYENR